MGAGKKHGKRKIGITDIIIALVLLAGVGILLYPTISNQITKWQLKKELEEYDTVVSTEGVDYSEIWEAAEAYNAALAQKDNQFTLEEGEQELVYSLLNPLGNNMMGYIEIPAIDVYLPIYQGTDDTQLQSGVGWWIGTSLPTGGESTHCVLVGHTGLVKSKMFTDLDQLEIGDYFVLTILNRTLTYEVDQILIVDPDDFSELEIVEGKDYVTLYTCYPEGENTYRLLVRGHRIANKVDAESVLETIRSIPLWVKILIVIAAAAIAALLGRWIYKKHQKKAAEAAGAAEAIEGADAAEASGAAGAAQAAEATETVEGQDAQAAEPQETAEEQRNAESDRI